MTVSKVNGVTYTHANAKITLDGKKYLGISSLAYNLKRDQKLVYGAGPAPIGKAAGLFAVEGLKFRMLKSEADYFISNLGDGFMDKEFSINSTWSLKDKTGKECNTTDLITRVNLTEVPTDSKEGEAVVTEFSAQAIWCTRNGLNPIKIDPDSEQYLR